MVTFILAMLLSPPSTTSSGSVAATRRSTTSVTYCRRQLRSQNRPEVQHNARECGCNRPPATFLLFHYASRGEPESEICHHGSSEPSLPLSPEFRRTGGH